MSIVIDEIDFDVDDDALTLVTAFAKQCPFVSNDEFYDFTSDCTRSAEVRDWVSTNGSIADPWQCVMT